MFRMSFQGDPTGSESEPILSIASRINDMRFAIIPLLLVVVWGGSLAAQDQRTGTGAGSYPRTSPQEPLARALSLKKSAELLDAVAVDWTRQRKCGTCHTNYPYLMARPALKEFSSPAMAEVRGFFENRVAHWDDRDKGSKPRWDTEVVATAAALAINDAATTGTLHPLTRRALDRMWTLQKPDGDWDWLKCDWPPYEHDDYYGAIVAALGAGHAPGHYSRSQSAQRGLDRLRTYFQKNPAPDLHHQTMLLWASTRLDGLMDAARKEATIQKLRQTAAERRRLEPAVARPLETPRRHGERPQLLQRRLRDRPGGLRAPPGECSGHRSGHPARSRMAQGQPAHFGTLVHQVAQQ